LGARSRRRHQPAQRPDRDSSWRRRFAAELLTLRGIYFLRPSFLPCAVICFWALGLGARRFARIGQLRRIEKAPLNHAPDAVQDAKAGPNTCLRGGRLELGRHLVQELVALAMIDRRRQRKQQVHFLVRQMQRHWVRSPGRKSSPSFFLGLLPTAIKTLMFRAGSSHRYRSVTFRG
jgi:hypothetical protein